MDLRNKSFYLKKYKEEIPLFRCSISIEKLKKCFGNPNDYAKLIDFLKIRFSKLMHFSSQIEDEILTIDIDAHLNEIISGNGSSFFTKKLSDEYEIRSHTYMKDEEKNIYVDIDLFQIVWKGKIIENYLY